MSHRDATLFSSDVASLAAPNFLLDGVINFVMAHMTTKLGDESLLLVSPSVASLLANLQDYEPEAVADTAQALMDGANLPAATRLADALRPLLPAPPQGPPISGPTPQLSNGYDCGVYLLAVALAICRWWKKHPRTEEAAPCWFESVMDEVSAESVAAMRLNLAQEINLELIKQGDTTSSSSSWPSSSSRQ
uniref:Ubiquitin-like protease family profile domain-containing protein n=1 Tax=Oryza glumipatula TaxID=40148 RepID=A0A0E0BND3_9ORYZ